MWLSPWSKSIEGCILVCKKWSSVSYLDLEVALVEKILDDPNLNDEMTVLLDSKKDRK